MSELTGQPIPIVMRISLLIKSNHPDQSNPKYYAQRRWFFNKTSQKKRISFQKCLANHGLAGRPQIIPVSEQVDKSILNGFLPGVVDGFGDEGTFVVPGSYTYSYKFSRVLCQKTRNTFIVKPREAVRGQQYEYRET